ncbi:interleukin-12 subunit beta [Anolis carolinensis]|uniref:interleukin-12 subunit beta n=1 Tax=Anolis carolinensis TaxID=28377 RepID=UPI002F2B15F7
MGLGALLLVLTLLLPGRPSSSAFAWTAFRDPAGVTCEALSYNNTSLRCSWEALRPATVRLHLRQKGELGANCSSREVRSGRGPSWVLMDSCPSACSSAAEETPMELEVEAGGNGGQHQRLSRSLLWRDLVKPAAPEGLWAHQEERSGQVRLRWAPPGSWDRPASFFPLRFHLHLEYFGNLDKGLLQDLYSDRLEETTEPLRPHQILRRAKVRCQDPVTGSAWGPWSGWALPSEATPLP